MKKDIYKIDNSIEKLLNNKHTLFLDQKELLDIKSKINKNKYNIYYPNKSSEKVILYKDNIPKISLYKINSYNPLKHQQILGSILSLNISPSYLGDIIKYKDEYYFYILSDLDNLIQEEFKYVGSNKITLDLVDVDYLKDYEREYETIEFIVSSPRIDNVIARLINTNRDKVIDLIKDKDVILNYQILTKNSYNLKENDIFSIRRYGKYKYMGIKNITKKDKIVVSVLKYL
ncbi:MAG: hypothetical protein E7159_00475 [Firmicutes bacterium]|nr:hypothetical protein [Bacillota bacterium]